jgi:hypothetical protein
MIVIVEFNPFEFSIEPDKKLWDEANSESREIYIKNQLTEYLENNIDELVNYSIKRITI